MPLTVSRRQVFVGAAILMATPAIVRAPSLMPVRVWRRQIVAYRVVWLRTNASAGGWDSVYVIGVERYKPLVLMGLTPIASVSVAAMYDDRTIGPAHEYSPAGMAGMLGTATLYKPSAATIRELELMES